MKIPEKIIIQLKENFEIDTDSFKQSHNQNIPTSVRLNPLKPECGFKFSQRVPWANNAHYLHERPVFTNDPLFHAGCYYVQEASSMFVEQAIKQTVDTTKKIISLDACAAPGGKSTLLTSLLNEESLLVSNEVISTRVPVLTHNLVKWGTVNSVVSNNDPKDFSRLQNFFDLIVVDAPCSGSGLFRKQEDAIEHWSEESVKHCSLRQQRILHDLIPSLKENGILIYSTCSYSSEENENICDFIVNEFGLEPVQLEINPEWGITETKSKKKGYGYRFFPHLTQGEGFFLTCFRKKTEGNTNGYTAKNKILSKLSSAEEKNANQFIIDENFEYANYFGEIVAYDKSISEEINAVCSSLKVKKMPLHLGQLKGDDFIPHPYSAYLSCLSKEMSIAEIGAEDSLKYLRKQNFNLPEAQKGFVLLTYKNFGIGWAKNLGNRINNYYPAGWRILKEVF
ncbi:MAG TPA: RNA methyltransferase [Bacteroidia bacterium]|jgi:16S rRNA C967 or C1407 C5-methylase (RsmB/RsmF family)/NOL1/NOP2/fmu family ribosome biogenesis protein|nr:RNA methyltransferase [Bacteroidia bacterium]